MRPVVSSVRVDRPRAEVFAHLDVLGNHEAFTDHYMRDWTPSGPASGVGARVRFRAAGRWLTMEVVAALAPEEIVEESFDDRGTRRNRGVFRLDVDAAGGTRVTFTYRPLVAPRIDRLAFPLVRPWLQRANDRALARLADQLTTDRPHRTPHGPA